MTISAPITAQVALPVMKLPGISPTPCPRNTAPAAITSRQTGSAEARIRLPYQVAEDRVQPELAKQRVGESEKTEVAVPRPAHVTSDATHTPCGCVTTTSRDCCPVSSTRSTRTTVSSLAGIAANFGVWYCPVHRRRLSTLLIGLGQRVPPAHR